MGWVIFFTFVGLIILGVFVSEIPITNQVFHGRFAKISMGGVTLDLPGIIDPLRANCELEEENLGHIQQVLLQLSTADHDIIAHDMEELRRRHQAYYDSFKDQKVDQNTFGTLLAEQQKRVDTHKKIISDKLDSIGKMLREALASCHFKIADAPSTK